MQFRPKAKSNIGTSNNAKGTKADVLKITLEHGDIMVMHGAEIQKHYEASKTSFSNAEVCANSQVACCYSNWNDALCIDMSIYQT